MMNQVVQELANRLGLQYEPETFLGGARLHGLYRHRPIRVDAFGNKPRYLRICTDMKLTEPLALDLSNQSLWLALKRRLGFGIWTTDREFDRRFALQSQPPSFGWYLCASTSMRRRLSECRALTIRLRGQYLCLTCFETDLLSQEYMVQLLNVLILVAERIEQYEQQPQALS